MKIMRAKSFIIAILIMVVSLIPSLALAHNHNLCDNIPEGYTGNIELLERRLHFVAKYGSIGEEFIFGTTKGDTRYTAICPNCNKSTRQTSGIDEYRIVAIQCPAATSGGGELDLFVEFRRYLQDVCTTCSWKDQKVYENVAQSYQVACQNGPISEGSGFTWYLITIPPIPGSNIHCFVDPDAPHEPVNPY